MTTRKQGVNAEMSEAFAKLVLVLESAMASANAFAITTTDLSLSSARGTAGIKQGSDKS